MIICFWLTMYNRVIFDEHINKNKIQNIELDPDAIKSDSKLQGFLEFSTWDQRVTSKHAYSDNDHGRAIKASPSLEIPSLLQIIQFLVECRQKLSPNGCQDKLVELIQTFQEKKLIITCFYCRWPCYCILQKKLCWWINLGAE